MCDPISANVGLELVPEILLSKGVRTSALTPDHARQNVGALSHASSRKTLPSGSVMSEADFRIRQCAASIGDATGRPWALPPRHGAGEGQRWMPERKEGLCPRISRHQSLCTGEVAGLRQPGAGEASRTGTGLRYRLAARARARAERDADPCYARQPALRDDLSLISSFRARNVRQRPRRARGRPTCVAQGGRTPRALVQSRAMGPACPGEKRERAARIKPRKSGERGSTMARGTDPQRSSWSRLGSGPRDFS